MNPPAKSAYDLARLLRLLPTEQWANKAAVLIEAYWVRRKSEKKRGPKPQ